MIIRPEVAGKITEIRFNEGQAIRKGAVVLRMDDAIARATVDQALAFASHLFTLPTLVP